MGRGTERRALEREPVVSGPCMKQTLSLPWSPYPHLYSGNFLSALIGSSNSNSQSPGLCRGGAKVTMGVSDLLPAPEGLLTVVGSRAEAQGDGQDCPQLSSAVSMWGFSFLICKRMVLAAVQGCSEAYS